MDKTQNLTAWLPSYKQCGNIKKYNPFDATENPYIKSIGPCVEVVYDEWGIELPVGIEEVAKFIKAVQPEDWKVEVEGSIYKFKDMAIFKAVVFYLLARTGGAKKTEAMLLVRHFGREGECLVDSLYDILLRCRLVEYNCENLVPTYAKIARSFVEVLPTRERRRRGGDIV
jgi:hypothetical protein